MDYAVMKDRWLLLQGVFQADPLSATFCQTLTFATRNTSKCANLRLERAQFQ